MFEQPKLIKLKSPSNSTDYKKLTKTPIKIRPKATVVPKVIYNPNKSKYEVIESPKKYLSEAIKKEDSDKLFKLLSTELPIPTKFSRIVQN